MALWPLLPALAAATSQTPSGLLVDLKPAPHAGVDRPRPLISWIVPHLDACDAAPRGQVQGHFQVQLSVSPGFLDPLGDSGRAASQASAAAHWPALVPPLEPGRAYWWRVRTWTPENCSSDWSEPAKIVTGLFGNDFSVAKPIWVDGANFAFLRRTVALETQKRVVSAHAYVAAVPVGGGMEKYLGAYRLYVDGVVAGTGPGRGTRKYAEPGHPDYDTLDLTGSVVGKRAVVLAMQGYNDRGDRSAKALLELHVLYADGSKQVVGTDSTWHGFNADKLFTRSSRLGGAHGMGVEGPREDIDARLSPTGDGCQTCWRLPQFTPSSEWEAASLRDAFSPALNAKITQPLVIESGVEPVSVVQVAPGHWFFDFGTEVMAGLQLEWHGGEAVLNLRGGEELLPNSNTSVLSPMRTGNIYQMSWTAGPGTSSFEQHEYWTFRYGELKATTASSSSVCAFIPAQNNVGPAASFSCPFGQAISKVTFASYGTPTGQCIQDGSNTFDIDIACHANASISVVETLCLGKQSCSFSTDSNMIGHFPCHETPKGFAGAVECSSGSSASTASGALPFKLTAWTVRYPWVDSDSSFDSSDAMLNSVWQLCRNSLKVTSLDTTTDSNTRERLPYEADGYITGSARYVFQREFTWQRHSTRHNILNPTWPTEWRQTIPLLAEVDYLMTGDAMLAEESWDLIESSSQAHCISSSSGLLDFSQCPRPSGVRDIVDWPQAARDGYQMTDVSTVSNAYAFGALNALATLANATGQQTEAARFQRRAVALSARMADELLDNNTGLFVDGQGSKAGSHSAWHAQVFPLLFGVKGADTSERLLAFLKSKRMIGSVYSAFAFVLGLYRFTQDYGAFALEMMTNCDDNSWCNMIRQGATAVMEAWTREEKPNLSWSHPWASAPATAIAQGVMGIRALEPAFRRFEVRPQPGSLSWAELKLPILPGFIETRIDRSDSQFKLWLTAPANTEATVCLPSLGASGTELVVDGDSAMGCADGSFVCLSGIGSGQHTVARSSSATTESVMV